MTTSMYCFYVGVDYTYIDINTLAQGITSFLASQLLVIHASHSATLTIIKRMFIKHLCMYVCMCVCVCVYVYVCMYACMHVYLYICIFHLVN